MHRLLFLTFGLGLLLASAVEAQTLQTFDVQSRAVSRANFREIQRDEHFYRVEKTMNTVFYRKHFEEAGKPNALLAYLVASANLYNIAPEAVLGAILAEHSMNQRTAMKQGGEMGINLLGKQLGEAGEELVNGLNVTFRGANGQASFGPGQIQPYVATAMIPEIKKMRPDASEEELDKYTWKGAINIICAYTNYAATQYEPLGYVGEKSFRDDPAILATLYNIGENRKTFAARAAETKVLIDSGEREGLWINYFGYWIQKNIRYIEKAVDGHAPAEAE